MATTTAPGKRTFRRATAKSTTKKGRTAKISKKPSTTGRKATTAMTPIESAPAATQKPELKRTDPTGIDARFQKAAEKLDGRIQDKITSVGRDMLAVGEMFNEVREKGYHTALGFSVFTEYVENRTGQGKTQVFQAMRVVRELTSGDSPTLTKDDVRDMPQESAETIARLKKDNVKITSEIVNAAKTMSVTKFQTEVAFPKSKKLATRAAANAGASSARSNTTASGSKIPLNTDTRMEGTQGESFLANSDAGDPAPQNASPLAAEGEVYIKQVWTLRSDTVADLRRCEAIARYVTRDADQSIPWQDRFLQSMCAEFIATYEATYEDHRADADAEGNFAATRTKEAMALSEDDLEEEITVTNERRVEIDGDSSGVVNEGEYISA